MFVYTSHSCHVPVCFQCFTSVVLELHNDEAYTMSRKGCLGQHSDPELQCRGEPKERLNVMCCKGEDFCNSRLNPTFATIPRMIGEGRMFSLF